MNNIIWTKEELKNIKKIILNRTSLKLDDNNDLIVTKSNQYIKRNVVDDSLYNYFNDEIQELFYYQDRNEIARVLENASQVKADPTNRNHFGLIMTLSRMNPDDHTNIFVILKEIVSLYEKISYNVAVKSIEGLTTLEEVKHKFESIKNSNEETYEEAMIKSAIENIFNYTNNLNKEEIFKNLINKYNTNIKKMLLHALFKKITRYGYSENALMDDMHQSVKEMGYRKFQKKFNCTMKSRNMSYYGKKNI